VEVRDERPPAVGGAVRHPSHSPEGAAQWIAATLATGSHPVRRAMEGQHRLAAELLGAPAARAAADASDARAVQVSLVLLLAAHEDALPADSWRRVNPDAARYLGFLASVGYDLAEIEQRVAGQEQFPGPQQRRVSNARPVPTGRSPVGPGREHRRHTNRAQQLIPVQKVLP